MKLDGSVAIDGVPGTVAPIITEFLDVLGPKTGNVLPTGSPRDTFDGVEVTCVDSVNPTVLLHATDLVKPGTSSWTNLMPTIRCWTEGIREQASLAMDLGDARGRCAQDRTAVAGDEGGHIRSRYFTPAHCHEAHAVSGAIAIAIATQCGLRRRHMTHRTSTATPEP